MRSESQTHSQAKEGENMAVSAVCVIKGQHSEQKPSVSPGIFV